MKIANYVYIMECQGKLKFGKSQNPLKRLKELRTGNPNRIRLIHYEKFPSPKSCSEAEKMMHYYFEKEKVRGEWFKSDEKEAKEILKYLVQKKIGLVLNRKRNKDWNRNKKTKKEVRAKRDKRHETYRKILKMKNSELLITSVEAKLLTTYNKNLNQKTVNYFGLKNNFPREVLGKMVSPCVFIGLCEDRFKR